MLCNLFLTWFFSSLINHPILLSLSLSALFLSVLALVWYANYRISEVLYA